MTLASKWVTQAMTGDEPWKILIRNNINRSDIKKGKGWKDVPLWDKLMGTMNLSVFGSKVFQSIWKAWVRVRDLLLFRGASGGPPAYSVVDRSIWCGVEANNKPLALTQSCSAKNWVKYGISTVQDVLIDNRLGDWEELSNKYHIPSSQKKTFYFI